MSDSTSTRATLTVFPYATKEGEGRCELHFTIPSSKVKEYTHSKMWSLCAALAPFVRMPTRTASFKQAMKSQDPAAVQEFMNGTFADSHVLTKSYGKFAKLNYVVCKSRSEFQAIDVPRAASTGQILPPVPSWQLAVTFEPTWYGPYRCSYVHCCRVPPDIGWSIEEQERRGRLIKQKMEDFDEATRSELDKLLARRTTEAYPEIRRVWKKHSESVADMLRKKETLPSDMSFEFVDDSQTIRDLLDICDLLTPGETS